MTNTTATPILSGTRVDTPWGSGTVVAEADLPACWGAQVQPGFIWVDTGGPEPIAVEPEHVEVDR